MEPIGGTVHNQAAIDGHTAIGDHIPQLIHDEVIIDVQRPPELIDALRRVEVKLFLPGPVVERQLLGVQDHPGLHAVPVGLLDDQPFPPGDFGAVVLLLQAHLTPELPALGALVGVLVVDLLVGGRRNIGEAQRVEIGIHSCEHGVYAVDGDGVAQLRRRVQQGPGTAERPVHKPGNRRQDIFRHGLGRPGTGELQHAPAVVACGIGTLVVIPKDYLGDRLEGRAALKLTQLSAHVYSVRQEASPPPIK